MRHSILVACLIFFGTIAGIENGLLKVTCDMAQAIELARLYHKPFLVVFLGGPMSEEGGRVLTLLKSKEMDRRLESPVPVFFADLNFQLFSSAELINYQVLVEQMQIQQFPSVVMINGQNQELLRLTGSQIDLVPLTSKIAQANYRELSLRQELIEIPH